MEPMTEAEVRLATRIAVGIGLFAVAAFTALVMWSCQL